MVNMEVLTIQLMDTFKSMKQKGLVNDHFTFIYSLKKNVGDHFYLELIPEFCSEVRDVLNFLAQTMRDGVVNYNVMKEYVYKVKGSSLSFGACQLAQAFSNFERATETASKEECLKALNEARHEYCALEQKLHICLQLERRIVLLATQGTNL